MAFSQISYQKSGYFSKLMLDYLNQEEVLKPLYHRFPVIENFEDQIREKKQVYSHANRKVLNEVLLEQYAHLTPTKSTLANINQLLDENTFTVTTGHQLNLFTGPLYFLYKIISTFNLTEELKNKFPQYNFVPVYWMATEDHDFEEINHFRYENKVISWNYPSKGPVGRLPTDGLDKVLEVFQSHLGIGINADYIKDLFAEAYTQHSNLADATRYLANALFGAYGLVILDGDHARLKTLFAPHIKDELLLQNSITAVEQSYPILENYFVQVTPRPLNLFYILDDLRERIIKQEDVYVINNTTLKFSQAELLMELHNHPERFSPNVILRPLYQEVLLPNLCYIGGGGELAYWLELKRVFDIHNVTFPMLLLRNSVLLATKKQVQKAAKLGLTTEELFCKQTDFIHAKTAELSDVSFDFERQRTFLQEQFIQLKDIAMQTDPSFIGAVEAQEKKQLKGLNNLEKRLRIAERKKHSAELDRMLELKQALFPNDNLQERIANFSEYYKEYGQGLIPKLVEELKPLNQDFTIIEFD